MSSENQNINVLENFITKPNSLEAERVGRSYFLDNHADVIPNEGNLMSLLTLQKFHPQGSEEWNVLKKVAQEETKYVTESMKMLTATPFENNGLTGDKLKVAQKLQQKFGNNFNASLGLAQMLKTKSEQVEFDKLINPIVESLSVHTKRNTFV